MSRDKRLNTVIAWVLAASTVLFVAVLAGAGSGLLTEDPPAVSPYASSASTVVPVTVDQAAGGRDLYLARCRGCHGDGLVGGVGPPLGPGSQIADVSDDQVHMIITDGKAGMPSFGDRLEPGEIDAIIAFLRAEQAG